MPITVTKNSTEAQGGSWFFTVLFCIFLILKLTGKIDWSWWWVTAPLWLPLAIVLGFAMFILLVVVLAAVAGVLKK